MTIEHSANAPPTMNRYQLSEIQFGESHVPRADHHREKKIAEHGGNGGNEEEPDHHHAVHGEELVVGLGGDEVALRGKQLEPHHGCGCAADEKEKRDRDHDRATRSACGLWLEARKDRRPLVQVVAPCATDWRGGACGVAVIMASPFPLTT